MELAESSVWDKPEYAQSLGKERARLESIVLTIEKLQSGVQEAEELLFLVSEEKDEELDISGPIKSDDPKAIPKLNKKLDNLEKEKAEIKKIPKKPRDFSFSEEDMRGVHLDNINANMRSVRQRIKQLESKR